MMNNWKIDVGQFFVDLAKLVFAGVVLATVMKHPTLWKQALAGLGVTLVLFVVGMALKYFKRRRRGG
jgi:uncharacterized membrane protein YagU involved in acid resistance